MASFVIIRDPAAHIARWLPALSRIDLGPDFDPMDVVNGRVLLVEVNGGQAWGTMFKSDDVLVIECLAGEGMDEWGADALAWTRNVARAAGLRRVSSLVRPGIGERYMKPAGFRVTRIEYEAEA